MTDGTRSDMHTHTKYLGCADKTMEIDAIVQECTRIGVTSLGITDHLNSLDKLELHRPIKKDLEAVSTSIDIYFGVELNYMGMDGEFAFNAELKEEFGFQFAIGGIHSPYVDEYDLKRITDIQHRHHIKTCQDPLVDVLVHPYWFSPNTFKNKDWPLPEDMLYVPKSYTRELGQVAKETGTAIEINGGGNLRNPGYPDGYEKAYIEYLSILADEGPLFSVGSDAHTVGRLDDIEASWNVIDELGLPADRIWMPGGKPFKAGQ